MKIESLKPGMIVFDTHSHRMGNTMLCSLGTWQVKIIEVDPFKGTVIAEWNGNEARKYWQSTWSKWTLKEPTLIRNAFGQMRRATREELKNLNRKDL